jgi:hypothetical protein
VGEGSRDMTVTFDFILVVLEGWRGVEAPLCVVR